MKTPALTNNVLKNIAFCTFLHIVFAHFLPKKWQQATWNASTQSASSSETLEFSQLLQLVTIWTKFWNADALCDQRRGYTNPHWTVRF